VIGRGYHVVKDAGTRQLVMHGNADAWKSFLHERFVSAPGEPGAMTMFDVGNENDHLAFAKHLLSEKEVTEFEAGRGPVTKWVRKYSSNHWLDASYMAMIAGHYCGVRIGKESVAQGPASGGGARKVGWFRGRGRKRG